MSNVDIRMTRRSALLGAAVATGGLAAPFHSSPAAADTQGLVDRPVARFRVGSFEVTTLLDGAVTVGDPQKTFGMNVDAQTFAGESRSNFIPADRFKAYFTPTLVNTGKELVLFDTGVGSGGRPARGNMRAALAAAGYAPENIDVVVITHMHPDHIGGLMEGGVPAFPNARYVAGHKEYDFWAAMDEETNGVTKLLAKNVKPLAQQTTFVGDDDPVVAGITAMAAFGHTPGHMTYLLEDSGQQLLLAADTANHFVWSLANPDWEVRFDMDKEAAATTRRAVFGMLANERIPFVGYHMPFPSVGYVATDGNGFRYVPASYQLNL